MANDEAVGPALTDAEALLWNLERDPVLRSTITAVMRFDRAPRWEGFRLRVERIVRRNDRLRRHIVNGPLGIGPQRWALDPDFDLDYHLRRVRLAEPAHWRDLLDLARPMAMAGFDRDRPLWELTLVEGLDGGKAAMVAKVHHAVTDGIGGLAMAADLIDVKRDAPDPQPGDPLPPAPRVSAQNLLVAAVSEPTRNVVGAVRDRTTHVADLAEAVSDPGRSLDGLAHMGRTALKLVSPTPEPMSSLMVRRSLSWQFETQDYLLEDLAAAGHAAGGTVNDAFLAAVAGGLRRYHAAHGFELGDLRMNMPISIRNPNDAAGGNRFVPARFVVPTGVADPVERMRAMGAVAREWRRDPALGLLTDFLAGVLARMPVAATTQLFGSMLRGVDFVATNVPGSPVPLYVAGAEVERFYALAPTAGAAVNFALVSHVGTCCLGITIDEASIPDPEVFLTCVREGFDEVIAVGSRHRSGVGPSPDMAAEIEAEAGL